MSILRQEFLTSAVKMRIDAEIRARLLNWERKENSGCVSNVTFTGANLLLKQGATAGSVGRGALGAGSITQGFSCCLQFWQEFGVFFYTSKQTTSSSVKKKKKKSQPYIRPCAQIVTD